MLLHFKTIWYSKKGVSGSLNLNMMNFDSLRNQNSKKFKGVQHSLNLNMMNLDIENSKKFIENSWQTTSAEFFQCISTWHIVKSRICPPQNGRTFWKTKTPSWNAHSIRCFETPHPGVGVFFSNAPLLFTVFFPWYPPGIMGNMNFFKFVGALCWIAPWMGAFPN